MQWFRAYKVSIYHYINMDPGISRCNIYNNDMYFLVMRNNINANMNINAINQPQFRSRKSLDEPMIT